MIIDIITVIGNIALALSVVVALIFGIAQVRAAEQDRKERLTLEVLRNFQSREFVDLMLYIGSLPSEMTAEMWEGRTQEEKVMFVQFAQQMEFLGLLVAEGSIDIDLVEKTLGSFVTSSWKKYRTRLVANRENDPYLGEYFEWLAIQIHNRIKKEPREPFYKNAVKVSS